MLDDSRRYVLDEGAPWLTNMEALWTVDPGLAQSLEALHPAPAHPVQGSKAGPPTLSLRTNEGRTVWLHSRYDPLEEGRRLIEPIDAARRTAFYLFGFGLGYHVELLFERAGDEAIFCVFEPDLRLLRTAFEQRDLSRLIESRRVLFFTRSDKADLLSRLTPQAALIAVGVEQVIHPPSLEMAGEFHRQMQTWLEEFASFSRTSINTVVLNSRRTAENISRNLAWYVASSSIARLQDRHKGEPAVIVSAGPSLRKNKQLLADLRDRAAIIAVQTTLQPLLEMGVEPHYVTSLDYHDICTRFYERLPATLNTELVAEPKASSAIFRMYPGPVTLVGNKFAESLLREMQLCKPELRAGATVAHLAFYLAEFMGCDPIIFVGQDLGFSDGLCYAPGTSYEDVWRPELGRFCTMEMKQWEQIVRERFILRRVPDYLGRPMYTEERLFTYLQQFERDFARSKARIIDATEGGTAKRGATPMPLAKAIGQFRARSAGEKPNAERKRDPAHFRSTKAGAQGERVMSREQTMRCAQCLGRRHDEAAEIEQIGVRTLPLLEEIRDHVEDQFRVNRAIGEIDGLRARMNVLGATYDLISELTQSTQLTRFESDRKIAAAKIAGLERQRRQVSRDIENVRGIIAAAADFQRLMEQTIKLIEAESRMEGRAAA